VKQILIQKGKISMEGVVSENGKLSTPMIQQKKPSGEIAHDH